MLWTPQVPICRRQVLSMISNDYQSGLRKPWRPSVSLNANFNSCIRIVALKSLLWQTGLETVLLETVGQRRARRGAVILSWLVDMGLLESKAPEITSRDVMIIGGERSIDAVPEAV